MKYLNWENSEASNLLNCNIEQKRGCLPLRKVFDLVNSRKITVIPNRQMGSNEAEISFCSLHSKIILSLLIFHAILHSYSSGEKRQLKSMSLKFPLRFPHRMTLVIKLSCDGYFFLAVVAVLISNLNKHNSTSLLSNVPDHSETGNSPSSHSQASWYSNYQYSLGVGGIILLYFLSILIFF